MHQTESMPNFFLNIFLLANHSSIRGSRSSSRNQWISLECKSEYRDHTLALQKYSWKNKTYWQRITCTEKNQELAEKIQANENLETVANDEVNFTDIVDAGKEAITLNDETLTTDDKEQSKIFIFLY